MYSSNCNNLDLTNGKLSISFSPEELLKKSRIMGKKSLGEIKMKLRELNLTLNKAQKRDIKVAMSNTFGFGGHNACVLFKKLD